MRKLFFLLLLVAPLSIAQVHKTVTVGHSTQRTDGTPLSLAEIDRVDIRCFATDEQDQPTGPQITALAIVPPNTVRATEPVFTEGEYICTARTVDTLGQESAPRLSNVFTAAHPCLENPSVETCAAPMAPESVVIGITPTP